MPAARRPPLAAPPAPAPAAAAVRRVSFVAHADQAQDQALDCRRNPEEMTYLYQYRPFCPPPAGRAADWTSHLSTTDADEEQKLRNRRRRNTMAGDKAVYDVPNRLFGLQYKGTNHG